VGRCGCGRRLLATKLLSVQAETVPSAHRPVCSTDKPNPPAMMGLDIRITQRVDSQRVISLAKQACEAILQVYNSEVRTG